MENSFPQGNHGVSRSIRRIVAASCAWLALAVPTFATAADGCTVLLCLSSGTWNSYSQCVPPVRELLRDLARGRPFPTCGSAGAGNRAENAWASAPSFCPPQYTRTIEGEGAPVYVCDYLGAVTVRIDGQPFVRTWWRMEGDSVTEFSPAAKANLGTWNTRFEGDYARWLAAQPPAQPVSPN